MSHAAAAAHGNDRRAFWLRKAHSLSGLIPVGAFMCFHLFENTSAAHGPKAFDDMVGKINAMPFVFAMEIFGIWIPILFHALFGFVIIMEGKSNALAYPYARNWLYWAQRITGIIAFVFIVFHFVQFRARKAEFMVAPFTDVQQGLSNPLVFWFYAFGIAACVFHLANGLAGFLFSWGLTVGPRAKRLAGFACTGLGLAVFALGMKALWAFR
jgi:succinate dehydrogenase / fumarate reductase cytochrome b subunit